MKKISEHIAEYLKRNADKPENIEKFSLFIEDFFKDLDEEDLEIKEAFEEDMEEFIYEINEETLLEVIESFVHKDGTHSGLKWTKEETDTVAKQYDVLNKLATYGKQYNACHFWFAMNYVYATHFNVNRSVSGYVELAMDEYANKNICFKDVLKHMVKEFHQ